MRIGIAGAGLLGRLIAWRLAGTGCEVTVYDPAAGPLVRAGAAGWTAAGLLSPVAELEGADATVAELGWRSLPLWAAIVAQLPTPVFFQRRGSLLLAHRGDEGSARRVLDALARRSAGRAAPRALSAAELDELEPAVHGPGLAWLLEGEGQIHSVQAMAALAVGASRRGVAWCWGEAVHDVSGGRIAGQDFDHVFDVRGLGARPSVPVADAGLNGALRGVRGELLWVHAPGLALERPVRLVHPRCRVYLVPRPDDVVVVGASEIESEDRSPISVRTLTGLLGAACSVLPALVEARVVHTETNLRPALPDNRPRVEQHPGLTRINGLFRHGWLVAPALVDDALREAGLVSASCAAALQ